MESLEDSNCQSMSDSFSLYERYMRSFNVADCGVGKNSDPEGSEAASSSSDSESSNSRGNIDLSTAQSNIKSNLPEIDCNLIQSDSGNLLEKSLDTLFVKVDSLSSHAVSLLDNSSMTIEQSLTDKSDQTDVQVSSEEYKREGFKQPIFLTSTMENSNNAVDSVPMFRDVRHTESVFKLPISELSFNGTIKHVLKLKPIVDPITALSSNNINLDEKSIDQPEPSGSEVLADNDQKYNEDLTYDNRVEKNSESTGDSQYEDFKKFPTNEDASISKWNLDQSHSSFEASFDSGVRSPDMFSDNENDEEVPECEPFWSFMKDREVFDKRKIRKIEERLQGILPPPSVTILKTEVTEMLKKYYTNLPLFNDNAKLDISEDANSKTPTKRVSFIEIPNVQDDLVTDEDKVQNLMSRDKNNGQTFMSQDKIYESQTLTSRDKLDAFQTLMLRDKNYDGQTLTSRDKYEDIQTLTSRDKNDEVHTSMSRDKSGIDLETSIDRTIDIKMCTQIEAVETTWPDILKCRHYDVNYNVTKYSEKFELLSLRYGERYVGAETDTSVNIYSGGFQSPSSATKRKAMRLKMAQVKSPGRRLSHLARRRQAFCSAATINEKAHTSTAKMVLIDKNYFPHRKLINSAERKSPRTRRTPGKKTPTRKTPGKKTPAKTPKTRSGGSSKKKAMRRLLMDSEIRSQPRETLKRALFISPENRKVLRPAPSSSVPQAMKTKRALFGSPDRPAETKSSDGTQSDQFLKRKIDALDGPSEYSRNKIAKSLSFGGDTTCASISFSRRASEVFTAKKSADLNDNHKQKLLWAVSEALRIHGWRMSSPGFREKASSLARLTRRLLTLPAHAAKMASTNISTSDTLLKIAKLYVFAIIQGRTVGECFQEEQVKLSNDVTTKISGYISANTYQQIKSKPSTSQIKENTYLLRQDQPKSANKNVLQDKLVNIDSNSNSSSGLSSLDKGNMGLFMSNSMPSFDEAAKMRARRQISFDNVDFPKR